MITKRSVFAFLVIALVAIAVAAPLNTQRVVTAQDGGDTRIRQTVGDPVPLAPECLGGFQNDDGTVGAGITSGNADIYGAEYYVPPSTPYQLTQACVCFQDNGDPSLDVDIVIFDDNAGEPGTELGRFSFTLTNPAVNGTWYDLPINQIVNGGFWVAFNLDTTVDPAWVCFDSDGPGGPVYTGLWSTDGGVVWQDLSGFGVAAYGIRAEGQVPPDGLTAYAVCSGDDLEIDITNGDLPMDVYVDGALVGTADALGQWYVTGPGAFNDVTLMETTGDLESVNLGSFNCPNFGVPNLGLVQINATAGIQPYGMPGLEMQNFVLPADFDGNGFDTYIVTDIELVDGEYWLGLFIGNGDWVYVPYSAVIPLTPIAGID